MAVALVTPYRFCTSCFRSAVHTALYLGRAFSKLSQIPCRHMSIAIMTSSPLEQAFYVTTAAPGQVGAYVHLRADSMHDLHHDGTASRVEKVEYKVFCFFGEPSMHVPPPSEHATIEVKK